jgi:PAS domain-containing protein
MEEKEIQQIIEIPHQRNVTSKQEGPLSNFSNNNFFNRDNLYREVIQSELDGFFLTDINGNILDVNDNFCKMVGYNRDEIISMGLKGIDTNFIIEPEIIPHELY